MRWTVKEVGWRSGCYAARRPSNPLARLAGVSIDSRTVARGELFVAIHGPRHDGHNFIGAALDAGALAAIVAQDRLAGFAESVRSKLIPRHGQRSSRCNRSRKRFDRDGGGALAACHRFSMAKTTTKEILAALLGLAVPRTEIRGPI